MHVFLDTTVLTADPRREKGPFVVLSRLGKRSALKVHLSDVTRREFISQQDANCDKIVQQLRKLVRQPITNLLSEPVNSILADLPGSFVTEGFDAWLKEIGAEVHGIKDGHGKRVFDSYIDGMAPFRERKLKDDFPDAFIWQSVVDLLGQVDHLHLVSNDVGFEKACEGLAKIKLHKDLASFVKSPPVAELTGQTPNVTELLDSLRENGAEQLETPLINALSNSDWDSDSAGLGECEVYVGHVNDPKNILFDRENYIDFGEGVLLVPFSAEVTCEVCYYVSGITVLEELHERALVESVNDHYWEVRETRDMHIEGYLSVDGNVTLDEITELRPMNQ